MRPYHAFEEWKIKRRVYCRVSGGVVQNVTPAITEGPLYFYNLIRQILTQVVVDKLSWEGRLLMFPAPVEAGAGIRCVHWENIGTDTHQFCLSHQLPDGWSTGGQRSWKFLPWHPCLRPCVPGQLSLCPVLLQASRDTSLQLGHTSIVAITKHSQ